MTVGGWERLLTSDNLGFLAFGLSTTLKLAILSMLFSFGVGILVGTYRTWVHGIMDWPALAYVELFRNTPLLILIFFMRFGPPIIGVHLSSFVAGTIALTVYTGAYIAETVRAGIQSVPRGQWEAAMATGLSKLQSYRLIVLPQALRIMTPALLGQFVVLIKGTSLVSVIGVLELTRAGDILFVQYANPMETFALIGITYFVVNFALTSAVRRLESMRPGLSAGQLD